MDEDNPPKLVYPYAFLTARAEFGTNDSEQVFLYCPLIAEGLPNAQRPAHADFSIYPSSRLRREGSLVFPGSSPDVRRSPGNQGSH